VYPIGFSCERGASAASPSLCEIGTKSPIPHAKYDQVYPIGFSPERGAAAASPSLCDKPAAVLTDGPGLMRALSPKP
jgi:hypothetical protein